MFSTFHGIEVGKKGLMANNTAIQTIGHNLANIETEGYSRQRVHLKTFIPIYEPTANRVEVPGQIGTGVVVEDIQRIRDQMIDDRIYFEKAGLGSAEMRQQFLHQIEMILNEPDRPNIRTVMDDFWESMQKLAANPTERAAREELIQRTNTLSDTFRHTYNSLHDLRVRANALIEQRISEVNQIGAEIASLNLQIVKSEAMGDNPNDLYDRRDLLIEKLSKIMTIKVERNNRHEYIVYIGAENFVQGGLVNPISGVGNTENEGFVDVRWADGRLVNLGNGELAGLLIARDVDIKNAIENINTLAINLMDSVNEVHRDGFGLNLSTNLPFFKEVPLSPYANGDYDFNKDGNIDGVAIFRVTGREKLTPQTTIGSAGVLNFGPTYPNGPDVLVTYNPNDTIKDVIDRINKSDAGVVAYLNHKGQLGFRARFPLSDQHPEFVIRHLEDSGNLLVGIAGLLTQSGPAGAFDYQNPGGIVALNVPREQIGFTPKENPSFWMAINDQLVYNPDNIAAAGGIDMDGDGSPDRISGTGDNRIALAMAELRHKPVMIERQATFGDYFKSIIGDFGTRSESARISKEKNEAVVTSLLNLREQISGVNVDEELSKLLMFQHGYNASARMVTTVDRMIETILRMGA